jgi:Rrf2 family protein
MLSLAVAEESQTTEALAEDQGLPPRFLGAILSELRRAGLVASQRGAEGGYRLARPASTISAADVFRALDGHLAEVRGYRPDLVAYEGSSAHLQRVWVAVRSSLRLVLENTTLADIASGDLPSVVMELTSDDDQWRAHWPTMPPSSNS